MIVAIATLINVLETCLMVMGVYTRLALMAPLWWFLRPFRNYE